MEENKELEWDAYDYDDWDDEEYEDHYFEDYIGVKENLEDLCDKIKQHVSIIETNTDDMVVLAKCNEIKRDIDEALEYE